KEEIEIRNRADSMIYNTEKLLKENREKLPADDAKNIETAIEACKKAVESGGREEIERRLDELTKASHKMAEAMYKTAGAQSSGGQQQQQQETETPPSSEQGGEGVIDAEFEDVNKGK